MNNQARINSKRSQSSSGKLLTLKNQATLLAVAIGVIPVLTIGLISFGLLNRSLTQKIAQEQTEKNEIAANNFSTFLEHRINEMNAISKSRLFTDAKFRDASTLAEKTAILDSLKDELKFYNSIVFFDIKGDPIFQAKSDKPNTKNYFGKKYFQQAVNTGKMTINGPGISSSSGQLRVEFASPVKDNVTGKIIGILRFKIPGNYINGLFNVYEEQDKHWGLVNAKGDVFTSDRNSFLNNSFIDIFPSAKLLHQNRSNGYLKTKVADPDISLKAKQGREFISYVFATPPSQFPDLQIGTFLSLTEKKALTSINQLRWTLFLGTGLTAIVVATLATYIANRSTMPLIEALEAIKQIGQGNLDTHIAVKGNNEFAQLGSDINSMAKRMNVILKQQTHLAQEQRQEKEQLEAAIYTLLDEVGEATDGDLTVRANLDSMELSTVADLFNAIITNLQDIAIETKQSSSQVGSYLKQNEEVISVLSEHALKEAQETRETLVSVEQMSQSIQAVAANAGQAEKIADDTYSTALESSSNMDLTVNSMSNLRNTVGETSKKIKRLGESSQKISQVVSFIEEIAIKTNVLAINASIEAGRAGEYGEGFTIVAEQVGALAEQSATATREIAKIVAAIQAETLEVNEAMESGTTQVVETTVIMESTKKSLELVLARSKEINQLMESISQTTVSQANTSQNVTNLMQRISQMSETTSESSQQVAQSILATAEVAAKLESTVSQFKVVEST